MPLRFGFLPVDVSIDFGVGKIRPVDEYRLHHSAISRRTHTDGWVYPPLQSTVSEPVPGGAGKLRPIPGSERPALLWPVIASHELSLVEGGDSAEAADGLCSLIVHALGYLYGYRLQFANWQFEARIPIKHPQHGVHVVTSTAGAFLRDTVASWIALSPGSQRSAVNILYLHCRAPSYEWMWEQFALEYMVTDACYAMVKRRRRLHRIAHKDRLKAIAVQLDLHVDDQAFSAIVGLRNQLIHEALWQDGRPHYSASIEAHDICMMHRSFNQRMIAGLLGWRGNYVGSDWTDWRSILLFD